MMMTNDLMSSRVENERFFVLERVFDAPRELVFSMFEDAEHLQHWWGPAGWELPVCKIDFRPGGSWHYCMKCMDTNQGEFYGMESWGLGLYKEIDEPEKIVYTDYFSDAEGTINEDLPATEVTLTFIDFDGKTRLISRSEYVSAAALQTVIDMGAEQGIREPWDRLAERLTVAQQ